MYYYVDEEGRFILPFLAGALAGGAVVGVSRPRPVIAQQPYPMYQQPMPYYPQGPYYY